METLLKKFPLSPICLHSRIHALKTIPAWIKRDDELMHGSKTRKFASLIPFLKCNEVKKVLLFGGKYSNNLVGLSQMLIQHDIEPILHIKGHPNKKQVLMGNHLLMHLLVGKDRIKYIPHVDWYHHIAQKQNVFTIQEGANHESTISGLLTLATDIVLNEEENKIKFDHIFVDSGTGSTSMALILGLSLLGRSDITVHVFQLGALDYHQGLNQLKYSFSETRNCTLIHFDVFFVNGFTKPDSIRLDYIAKFAQREGILLDPLYTSQHFAHVEKVIEKYQGNKLVVHSGGNQALFGFQDAFSSLVQNSSDSQSGR